MRAYDAIIYGAYGYSGQLIAAACQNSGISVLLSGRDKEKLRAFADESDLPYEACGLDDAKLLRSVISKGKMVIHCAGPFLHTAEKMVNACLETGTHYLDITGEYSVFEQLSSYDARAKEHSILILPGTGFDVVPTDCLALHLKKQMPDAIRLQLAFTMSKGGVSRGTARTMVENLGYGSAIRQDGEIKKVDIGEMTLSVDFGEFRSSTMCIPWGDIATAWISTGIPNIEVYTAVPEKMIRFARYSKWFNWLMRRSWLKSYLRRRIDSRKPGPSRSRLDKSRSYLWGRVSNLKGEKCEGRLETMNGYLLTAKMTALIAGKLSSTEVRPGYYTPAQYFGEDLIFELEGTRWISPPHPA